MQLKQKGKCVTSRGIKQFARAKLATQRLHISLFNMQKKFSKCLSRRGKACAGVTPREEKCAGASHAKKEYRERHPTRKKRSFQSASPERKSMRGSDPTRGKMRGSEFCFSKLSERTAHFFLDYQPSSISQLLRARSLSLSERPSGIRYSLLMLPSEI